MSETLNPQTLNPSTVRQTSGSWWKAAAAGADTRHSAVRGRHCWGLAAITWVEERSSGVDDGTV